MKILIIGSGGREHALTLAYSKSNQVTKILVAPGNGLMDYKNKKVQLFPNVRPSDFEGVLKICKEEKVDLVDVAMDDPLALGFVDRLQKEGIRAFGPTKDASEIEWSKKWSREFMVKYKLPIPEFESFTNKQKAKQYIEKLYSRHPELVSGSHRGVDNKGDSRLRGNDNNRSQNDKEPLVFIKANGLALGKGVIRADTKEEAISAIEQMAKFGKAGETFLIEEGLVGEEFSFFAICDGETGVFLGTAQDHKRIFNGDEGPNTGGMGCISPPRIMTKKLIEEIEGKILKPFLRGMQKEKRPYTGIFYLGGMVTSNGIKIIEFNARHGDPEAEVILPAIQTDYLDLVEAAINKKLKTLNVKRDNKVRVSVAGATRGYPGSYPKGKQIFGIPHALKMRNVEICGAGIKRVERKFFTDGGRIFHVIGTGKNIMQARKHVYAANALLHVEGNNLHYRTDIGWRDMERIHIRS